MLASVITNCVIIYAEQLIKSNFIIYLNGLDHEGGDVPAFLQFKLLGSCWPHLPVLQSRLINKVVEENPLIWLVKIMGKRLPNILNM